MTSRSLRNAGLAWALWLGAITMGCDSGEDPQGAGTHIEDLPKLVLEEELRIGSVDDPEIGFTRIGDVWVSPAGEVYVSERSERQIRVYGADGQLARTYGREGDGPGEFRSVGWFGVVGDTLWVSDGSLHRTTLFGPDGEVAATVTAHLEVPLGEVTGIPRTKNIFPHALRSDGLIESIWVNAIYANLPDSIVDLPRVLFDRNGQVVDTLEIVPTRVSRTAIELQLGNRISFVYPDPPASDTGTTEVQLDSGSFVLHWSVGGSPATGSLVAVRVDAAGDTTGRHTFRYDPRPVTDHYLDSIAGQRARGGLGRGDSIRLFEAQRAATRRPPHHRPVRTVSEIGEGNLWARLYPEYSEAERWLIFRESGEPVGSVTLPPNSFPYWSRGDTTWVVERDAFDIPWVVRYRLVNLSE